MQHRKLVLAFLLLAVGLLDPGHRGDTTAHQIALALCLGAQIFQLVLGLPGFGPDLAQVGLHLLDRSPRRVDFCLGLGERQLVVRGLQAHEHVACRNSRVIVDAQLHDAAGHFAGDLGNVGLDEGVLRRHVAAALQPEGQRRHDDQHGHADQRQSLHALAHGTALPL